MPRSLVVLPIAWLLLGCGVDDAQSPGASPPLSAEVGFLDVPADTYRFDGMELHSSPTRLFYSFHPATLAPDRAPLLVLHAGGPVASSLFVMAYGTAGQRLDLSSGVRLVPNASSLADVANLLYLDPRQAGFSYSTLADPAIDSARVADLSAANYNPYRDAADMLEGLLSFLGAHPALANREIYFLGESYGGLRTSLMSSFLLFAPEYEAGTRRFVSPSLSVDVRKYFQASFGDGQPAPPAVATWLRGQILVEPWFAGQRQLDVAGALLELPDSILDEVAAQTGYAYQRCSTRPAPCAPWDNALGFVAAAGRSIYDIRASSDWLSQHTAAVTALALDPGALAALFDVATPTLAGIFTGRTGAYRFADIGQGLAYPQGDLPATLGAIEPWDAYFVALNEEARTVFFASEAAGLAIDPVQASYGDVLVEDLRYLPTFISRATYDLVVFGPALLPTLASYPSVGQVTEPVDGTLLVQYTDGTERTVVSPWYATSHAVERDDPAKLHDDIAMFLGAIAR